MLRDCSIGPADGKGEGHTSVLTSARMYVTAGLSVIPVRLDGSKAPTSTGWRAYSERHPSAGELLKWFSRGSAGIGVTGGAASGNLVVLDIESRETVYAYAKRLSAEDKALLSRHPCVWTPRGGAHVWIRLTEPVKGCKLARDPAGKTLIETRGSNHFVVAPGSPASVHETGIRYRFGRLGWLDGGTFERMPLEAWHNLTVIAAEMNQYAQPTAPEIVGARSDCTAVGDRPGDHFDQRAAWGDILSPHGWRVSRATQGATYWCRPGKSPLSISASTGFCKAPSGNDLLYVFSTSAAPFDAEKCYSKFAAYALLNHRGDFVAASRALAIAGYCSPRRNPVVHTRNRGAA